VHLRARHRRYGWTPDTTRDAVTGLAADGYLPRANVTRLARGPQAAPRAPRTSPGAKT
jgi:hypothetical protein